MIGLRRMPAALAAALIAGAGLSAPAFALRPRPQDMAPILPLLGYGGRGKRRGRSRPSNKVRHVAKGHLKFKLQCAARRLQRKLKQQRGR
jgi:hypothetical protein